MSTSQVLGGLSRGRIRLFFLCVCVCVCVCVCWREAFLCFDADFGRVEVCVCEALACLLDVVCIGIAAGRGCSETDG